MSYPMEDHSNDGAIPGSPQTIGQSQSFRIKRSGARPLKFTGSELAMAMSFTPDCPYWYEINLYRTTDSRFVVAVRLFHQSEDATDTIEAAQFDALEDALWHIETYDAANDLTVPMHQDPSDVSSAELAASAMELRSMIKIARHHYQSLAGEFLSEIELAA